VSFEVDPAPEVLQTVRRVCSRPQQLFFHQVLSILSETPYRYRDCVHKNIYGDGRVFYQYYDGIIPLAFLYTVIPAEEDWQPGDDGHVAITLAEPPW
jgi:hypothetical protein